MMPKSNYVLILCIFGLIPLTATAQEIPTPASDDLWDVTQGATVTSVSGVLNTDYTGANMFGFISNQGSHREEGNFIFEDELPPETVHSIEWQTPQPIYLSQFRLFAYHDQSKILGANCIYANARVRGFNTFRLFAKNEDGEFELVDELEPIIGDYYRITNPEYQGIAPNDVPNSGITFLYEGTHTTPIRAQEFRAEFVQEGDPEDPDPQLCSNHRGRTGPRIVELDGFGSTEPPEPERDPIVIVPGMLGSVSPLTTFLDIPSNFWVFNIVARGVYASLTQQLETAGYYENQDVFFAHYDWKDPVNENATNYLKPTIDYVKEQTGAAKVDIVAHSMGGLVARSYIQSDEYNHDVDQLITLGTPHKGAADAYVAWEGGQMPKTWGLSIRSYMFAIELALQETSGTDLNRPLSFRTFFPSLRDILPITPFITQSDAPIPITSLAEQNTALQQLQLDIAQLEEKEVDVTTIVGSDIATLATIALSETRTREDEALDRWRDGHPIQEPILPNSNEGDQRVLLSSAELGDNVISLPNAQHDRLPETAQEEILDILGIEQPEPFHYESPDIDSLLGVTILSPIDPIVTCGEKTLSKDQNTFELAQYIADPEHPNSPKILTIANPPKGECTVKLTGTGAGEYAVITTFADEDDLISTQREGITSEGKQESFSVFVSTDSLTVPAEDIVTLIGKLKDAIKDLKQANHIESKHFGKINGKAGHLEGKAKSYQHQAEKHGLADDKTLKKFAELQKAFAEFRIAFEEQMKTNSLHEEAVVTMNSYVQRLEDKGL